MEPITADRLTILPANEATAEDLGAVFGVADYPFKCQCQRFKTGGPDWNPLPLEARVEALREQTACGQPSAPRTSGLVAYLDGEPVGWCAVEPRPAYPMMPRGRLQLAARGEDANDDGVWAVTCFVTRKGYRRRGITYALAAASVPFARERGARALEAYPMITHPGVEITWGELHVGSRQVFDDAGFTEVAHPTPRRVIMRLEMDAFEYFV
ncbi:GNAT family N-acetyltransferase [Sinomonas albida]|uniref:GNAT family N-acetyltransferase n=1 Tax=Sinomonas albida TaxID=369942 RepID=UPI001F32A3E3|nr:GNAT family N-acetyltransferase [Sinomonas albida]